MKKSNQFLFAVLVAAFLSVASFSAAQVTIGGTNPPAAGAILDLNSTAKGGLALSNVSITDLNAIPYDDDVFPGIDDLNHDTKKGDLAGMIVWNTNDCLAPNGDGLYLWNGNKWFYTGGRDGLYLWDGKIWIRDNVATVFSKARTHFNTGASCPTDPVCKKFVDEGYSVFLTCDADHTVNVTNGSRSESLVMKPVTGGVFYMGNQTSNSGNPNYNNTANAYTVHQVALSSFYMSETEITQKMYQTVMNIDAPSPNWDAYGKCPTCAAYRINWYDAIAFCNKLSVLDGKTPCYTVTGISDWVNLAYDAIPHSNYDATWNAVIWDKTADGYRLATEAEWEYAARGGQKNRYTRTLGAEGTQYVYSGSNNLDSVAWHSGNGSSQSHPVKSKKANELGLYDMSGNVWEYCWDWAGNAYSTCCVESPDGGGSTTERVMRGGCWYVGTYRNSVSERFNPSGMWNRGAQDLGFRIARSAL